MYPKELLEKILHEIKNLSIICVSVKYDSYPYGVDRSYFNLVLDFFDKENKLLNDNHKNLIIEITIFSKDLNDNLNKIEFNMNQCQNADFNGIFFCKSSDVINLLGEEFMNFFNDNNIQIVHHDYKEIKYKIFNNHQLNDNLIKYYIDSSKIKLEKDLCFWIQPISMI